MQVNTLITLGCSMERRAGGVGVGYGAGGRGSTDGLFVVRRIITFTTCLKTESFALFSTPIKGLLTLSSTAPNVC